MKSTKGTATIEFHYDCVICGGIGTSESVCFVGIEATKVLERLQDWVDKSWGRFSQLTRAIGRS